MKQNSNTISKSIKIRILKRLEPDKPKSPKKTISVSLTIEQLNKLEKIAKTLSRVSGKHVSRNELIEDAIKCYLTTAKSILSNFSAIKE